MFTGQLDVSVTQWVQHGLGGSRRLPGAIPDLLFARIMWETRRFDFSLHLKEKKKR